MKVPVVRLKIRVRLPSGSRPYLDPVFSANGKLKPGFALIAGVATHCTDAVYHLRYLKGGKRVWEAVGADAQLVLIAKAKREKALAAMRVGVVIADDGTSPAKEMTVLLETATEYLDEVAVHKSSKTYAAYSIALNLFTGRAATETPKPVQG